MRHDMDCHVDPVRVEVDPSELDEAATIFLAVAGMGCANCAARVHNALLRTEGVLQAQVAHPSALARVWYAPDRAEPADLCRAVAGAAEGTHHDYRAVPVPTRYA